MTQRAKDIVRGILFFFVAIWWVGLERNRSWQNDSIDSGLALYLVAGLFFTFGLLYIIPETEKKE